MAQDLFPTRSLRDNSFTWKANGDDGVAFKLSLADLMEMWNLLLCINHPSSQKKRAQKTSSITTIVIGKERLDDGCTYSKGSLALYRESPSMLNSDISRYNENVHPIMDDAASRFGEVFCSGVAATPVGAGELRLFIIGNYVKQRLLKPYHDWAMSVLRRLDCDVSLRQRAPTGEVDTISFSQSFPYFFSEKRDSGWNWIINGASPQLLIEKFEVALSGQNDAIFPSRMHFSHFIMKQGGINLD
ncbi:hypothetical protein RND71_030662 [Anisodus tanguticus]|uniref:Uncharacterized protein n=1 Tax=Anisodus tanguticus TaxID=243964 RepID=A0AAE1RHL4_9SOLA|nr:hypothetical protein RND71_030662 [Anisodus tanguticus]